MQHCLECCNARQQELLLLQDPAFEQIDSLSLKQRGFFFTVTHQQFTHTVPACRPLDSVLAVARCSVNTPAARP